MHFGKKSWSPSASVKGCLLFAASALLMVTAGCDQVLTLDEPIVSSDGQVVVVQKIVTVGPDEFLRTGQGRVSAISLRLGDKDHSILWTAYGADLDGGPAWPVSVLRDQRGWVVVSWFRLYECGLPISENLKNVRAERYAQGRWHVIPSTEIPPDAVTYNVLSQWRTLDAMAISSTIDLESKEYSMVVDGVKEGSTVYEEIDRRIRSLCPARPGSGR